MALPENLTRAWHTTFVLKRDVFSTVERGNFIGSAGKADAVLRRLDEVPWWTRPVARHLFERERRALAVAGPLGIGPRLLFSSKQFLVREFIDGVALHVARPHGDAAYFKSAKSALRRLHRARVCHNDLAKEQNWLRAPDGHAFLTDFQLAMVFRRRSKLFRLAAYEDLRHLLKHKRSYLPSALTASERRILARKSLPTRIWMATGKRVYRWLTRGVFGFVDREGAGQRMVRDAPLITSALKGDPRVRDATVVAFPDRRAGTGLYAFVEARGVLEHNEVETLLATCGAPPPERVQVVDALPRDAAGRVRSEILQLVAMNQVDLIEPLLKDPGERDIMSRIIAGRQNLRDRFAF
jgi:tRNA A-37 threonylcarbamoyl transferase component Bud32